MSRVAAFLAGAVLASAVAGGLVLRAGVHGSNGQRDAAPSIGPASVRPKAVYQCPMHPQIVRDAPGQCPICGMNLQLVVEEDGSSTAAPASSAAPAVEGRVPVTISPERQQLVGVRTARVEVRRLEREIRAPARVAYDPKLYQAVIEYREALRTREALSGSSSPEARDGAERLASAAGLKLRQQGISERQLHDVLRGGADAESLLLPGRTAWIYAQVYDEEAALIRPGLPMEILVPALPGRVLHTRVASLDPVADPATRTIRVRALVSSPSVQLRPESLVEARIVAPLGEAVAIPEEAIIDTGRRQIVFVVRDRGHFEPRAVVLGRVGDGWREVLEGVGPGDEVVVSANFLVDSESRFRAAAEAFAPPSAGSRDGSASPAGPAPARHDAHPVR